MPEGVSEGDREGKSLPKSTSPAVGESVSGLASSAGVGAAVSGLVQLSRAGERVPSSPSPATVGLGVGRAVPVLKYSS